MTNDPITAGPVTAGLPHLDIFTLSETWALGEALHGLWARIGESLGRPPSAWIDDDGRRIYAAVMAFQTQTDLVRPVAEDAELTLTTRMTAVRKPHAIGDTVILANGQPVMRLRLLTSLVRRDVAGSNKKLSKVRNLWQAADQNADQVDAWLAQHHAAKTAQLSGPPILHHEANRLADFNAADLFYFRNYAHLARAAEWRENRGQVPRLAADRHGFFYGNVDDGEMIEARVQRQGDACRTELSRPDGSLLFLSLAQTPQIDLPQR